jgi:hypothetical protein
VHHRCGDGRRFCWRRTAAPPLRGYRMVGRVLMKYLPQFEGRRWRSCWLMATEVGGDRHGECIVEGGAEITSRPKITFRSESRIWKMVNVGADVVRHYTVDWSYDYCRGILRILVVPTNSFVANILNAEFVTPVNCQRVNRTTHITSLNRCHIFLHR